MHTWERLRKTEEFTKMVETFTLNTVFSLKENVRIVAWVLKGEEGN